MEASFWNERWELGQIAFHEKMPNSLLVNQIEKLNLDKGARVFLPLCGKTLDFAYLLNFGYQVVGIELSELAIKELFQDLKLTPTISIAGELTLYQAEGIDIFVGDFFKLNSEILGTVDAIYDRAALVALPFEMRKPYTQHLTEITLNAIQLLICFEYDQASMDGPPFSISPDEISQHYKDLYSINCVEKKDIAGGLKKKAEAQEVAWILKPLG